MVNDENDSTKHKKYVAAMDLGTNSSRLLIADDKAEVVYRDVKHVALGEGLAENGCFCAQSMERGICSFMDFAEMLELYHVSSYRAIATAACRMSSNTKDFLAEVKKTSGIDVEVISEFEEARLTLKGACLNAPKEPKYLFVYDLGGGSTEVTFATNTSAPEILATYSIPLGARNATEMFGLNDYDEKKAMALHDEVCRHLSGFLEKVKAYPDVDDVAVIATSSTPLRLGAWLLEAESYDKFAADGKTFSRESLDDLIGKILAMSFEERAQSPYVGPNRAKIFVAACVIFQTIYQLLGAKEVIASLKGAQEAIISEVGGDVLKHHH